MIFFGKVEFSVQKKIVVIRPGALGDVIATRSLLGCARSLLPDAFVSLVAPGERGRFLFRHCLADDFLDWESREIAWLFTDSEEKAPPKLSGFFNNAALVLSFAGRQDGSAAAVFEKRLQLLAPDAKIIGRDAIPPANTKCSVYDWLCLPFLTYTGREEIPTPARIRIAGPTTGVTKYAVIHPGSGGRAKNWPLKNYASVANFLLRECPWFSALYVTQGEADAGLGQQLCHAVPGAQLVSSPALDNLAVLLANAALYIGNDSGVSHLAGAVENDKGDHPDSIVVFGPSNSTIWRPPLAHVFEAGEKMDRLDPAVVCDLLFRTYKVF